MLKFSLLMRRFGSDICISLLICQLSNRCRLCHLPGASVTFGKYDAVRR
jgi:hypothetical protein